MTIIIVACVYMIYTLTYVYVNIYMISWPSDRVYRYSVYIVTILN